MRLESQDRFLCRENLLIGVRLGLADFYSLGRVFDPVFEWLPRRNDVCNDIEAHISR